MRYLHFILLLVSLISFDVGSVWADYIEPNAVKVETEKYPIVALPSSAAKYSYNISWQGIPVGVASFEVLDSTSEDIKQVGLKTGSDNLVEIKAEAHSVKVVDVFYRLRHESSSIVDRETLRPVKFQTWQKENSKIKTAQVEFSEGGRISSYAEKDGKVERKHEFVSDNFTLDPISAAFFARSIPIAIGTKASFDVFNGKHRYLISFEVVAEEDLEVMGVARRAFKAVPSVVKLTDTEGEKRLTAATIWIAADDTRELLKMESKVFIGSVGATLVKVESSAVQEVKLAAVK